MEKIINALKKNFNDHRVIFWYDPKQEFTKIYEELEIDGLQKIQVEGNEFEVKYRINKQEPESNFLLYFTYEKPVYEDNWLLDMELAYYVFETDQSAMYLQELGLGLHLKELVEEHLEFFKKKDRVAKLKELIARDDTHHELRNKMLSIVFNTPQLTIEAYIQAHAASYLNDEEKVEKKLKRYNLDTFYWKEIEKKYNYISDTPTIYDFLLEAFNKSFVLGHKSLLSKEVELLLILWQDRVQYRQDFDKISAQVTKDLGIETKLNDAELEDIIDDRYFELTDKKVVHALVGRISSESIKRDQVSQFCKIRENKFWSPNYCNFYSSLVYAAELIELVRKYSDSKYSSFNEGIKDYSDNLFKIDQAYRKFIYSYRQTKNNKILADLAIKVEKVYSNDWLLNYNNNWQKVINDLSSWTTDTANSQQNFFKNHVQPFLRKKQRLFVIISDALRYECGAELTTILQSENRYEATIDHLVSSLPSYTQLGMASLLPHTKLSFKEGSDSILADDLSSSGTQGRTKILKQNSGVRATAIKAEDLMKMNSSTNGREFVKDYDLIYIYHNRIDKTGDDKTSEEKVFEAVNDEFLFIVDLIKKIGNMNGNNIIITSDHGFLYQHGKLAESDFCISSYEGEFWKENRRFVIGRNLTAGSSTKLFKGSNLNIEQEVDVLIPKSINRLRVQGAGSRFVHGGATLQEVVIPLIKVKSKRSDTITQVDIDIIKSTDRITTNILPVSFIQQELITDKILARELRTGLYSEDGTLLSDQFLYNFDINEGSERQREVKHRFTLSSRASSEYKNQRVKLFLEEPIPGTNKWKAYNEYYYTLNISFTNDFDEF